MLFEIENTVSVFSNYKTTDNKGKECIQGCAESLSLSVI